MAVPLLDAYGAYYGVAALMLVVICPAALIWSEMAPVGDPRRRAQA